MRINLNSRLLRAGFIILPLSYGATILSGCEYLHPTTDAEHVARAKNFQEQGDLQTSVIELKSALGKNPNNIEARRLLGEINILLGRGADAESNIRRALDLGIAKDAVLIPLASALLLQNKNKDILAEIDAPKSLDATEQASLYAYRGSAWLGLGKIEQARAEYQQALTLDSQCALAKLGLAQLAATIDQDVNKAMQIIDEALRSAPNEVRLWRFKAELQKSTGDFGAAEASYDKSIALSYMNLSDQANRALVRIQLKKYEKAGEDVATLKEKGKNYFMTYFVEGVLLFSDNQYPKAEVAFTEALKLNERYPRTHYYLGFIYLLQNRIAEAEISLSLYLASFPRSIMGHKAMALVKIRKNDYSAARNLIQPAMQYLKNDIFSLKLMANIELALGNRDTALEYLQRIVELEPESGVWKMRLGLGLLDSGHDEEGLEALENAVEMDQNLTQADVQLVARYVQMKDYERAESIVRRLKEKKADDALLANLEGIIRLSKGEEDEAAKLFHEALQRLPGDPTAGDNLASLALLDNRREEARDFYRQVLDKHPQHVPTLTRVMELDALEGKLEAIEAGLNMIVKISPDTLEPRLLAARYFTRFGQPQKALEALDPIRRKYSTNIELLQTLAIAELETGNVNRGLQTSQELAKAAPNSALTHYLLARSQGERNDIKTMRSELEQSLRIDPKFLPSRLVMVKLLALERKPAEAEAVLAALEKDYPAHPEVMALKGLYALLQKKPAEAVKAYRAVFEKYPSTSIVINLARSQSQMGQKQEAAITLEEWNRQHPRDIPVLMLRSALYRELGRLDDAKIVLEKVLEIDGDHVVALNDLAWLIKDENPGAARDYVEKAMLKAPKSPMVLDTLGVILLNLGEHERSVSMLKQADTYAPQTPSIRYHLALALQKNGKFQDALAILKELAAGKAEFDEKADVKALLNKLSSRAETK
jgi:putative PEP-CTERM system TPR-repeat lipoprotein